MSVRVHYRSGGYTAGQVLLLLGITRKQLADLVTAGRVTPFPTRGGHQLRYPLDEVNDLSTRSPEETP